MQNIFCLKTKFSKTISSKYIGGDSNSTFYFNYLDPKQTKITGVSSNFVVTGNFNFNGENLNVMELNM